MSNETTEQTEATSKEGKGETKQQAGVRLANQRMPKLKKALIGIGNLGVYGLDKKQIKEIEKALDKWVSDAKARLNNRQNGSDDDFKL